MMATLGDPKTRVEEIRRARRLSKAEVSRRSKMPIQTLHNIETGKTKSLSPAAAQKLAPALAVSEYQLLLPIGADFDPEQTEPIFKVIAETCEAILAELREIKAMMRASLPPRPAPEEEAPDEPDQPTG